MNSFWQQISQQEPTVRVEHRFLMFTMYWISYLKLIPRNDTSLLFESIKQALNLLEGWIATSWLQSIDDHSITRAILYLWLYLVNTFDLIWEKIGLLCSFIFPLIKHHPNAAEQCFMIHILRAFFLANRPIKHEETAFVVEAFWKYLSQAILVQGWTTDPISDYDFIKGTTHMALLKSYAVNTLIYGFRHLNEWIASNPDLSYLSAKCVVYACIENDNGFQKDWGWLLLRNEVVFECLGFTDSVARVCKESLRREIDVFDWQSSNVVLLSLNRLIDILSATTHPKAKNQHLSDLLALLLEIESALGNTQEAMQTRHKIHMYLYVLMTHGLYRSMLVSYPIHLERILIDETSSYHRNIMMTLSCQIIKAWLSTILDEEITATSDFDFLIDAYSEMAPRSQMRLGLFK
jgi:hypothetical protein